MNALIYAEVSRRAGSHCECCGEPFGISMANRRTLDHLFGRKNAESVESCWMLRWDHHEAKGANRQSAAHWLRKFIAHCEKHAYEAEKKRAEAKLAVQLMKFPPKE